MALGLTPRIQNRSDPKDTLASFATSIDLASDPRKTWWQKALNLASGARVTDVDVEKQRAIETRDALEKILQGQPGISQYTDFYVKPQDAAKLTPEDVQLMREYSTIQDAAKKYAAQQKKQIGVQQ